MPKPAMTLAERNNLSKKLSKAMAASGLSRRRIAHIIAERRDANPATLETNLRRWTGDPREGAIDAPPPWIFDEVADLPIATPQSIAAELREAVKRNYIAPGLALRAAMAIEGLISKR